MDLDDPRHLTTLRGYLNHAKKEKEARRNLREAGPVKYEGQVADSEKARRQIEEMIASSRTDWEEIKRRAWEED